MKKVLIQGTVGEYGCMVYSEVEVSEDYTMIEMLNAVRNAGFKTFRIVENEEMKAFAKVW